MSEDTNNNNNILVDPENGFKTFKLDENGCQPGHKFDAKLGRCVPEEEQLQSKPLNGEEDLPKSLEDKS